MMENEIRINPPLTVDLGEGPGHVVFQTFAEVSKWANEQETTWRVFEQFKTLHPVVARGTDQQLKIIRSLKSHANMAQDSDDLPDLGKHRNQIEQLLAKFKEGHVLHSNSTKGFAVIEEFRADPARGAILLAKSLGFDTTKIADPLPDIGKLITEKAAHLESLVLKAEENLSTFDQLNKNFQSNIDSIRNNFSSQFEFFRKNLDETLEDARKEIAPKLLELDKTIEIKDAAIKGQIETVTTNLYKRIEGLEKAFLEKLALTETNKIWQLKAKIHHRNFLLFFLLFVLGITLTGYAFWTLGIPILERAHDQNGQADAWSFASSRLLAIAELLVPTGLAVWILKLLSRFFQNERYLAQDALERKAIAEALISMTAEGNSDVGGRTIAYEALFRSTTHLAFEDHSPFASIDNLAASWAKKVKHN